MYYDSIYLTETFELYNTKEPNSNEKSQTNSQI